MIRFRHYTVGTAETGPPNLIVTVNEWPRRGTLTMAKVETMKAANPQILQLNYTSIRGKQFIRPVSILLHVE